MSDSSKKHNELSGHSGETTEQSQTDREWVHEAKEGDESAYQKLVERYRQPLHYYIGKMVREQSVVEDLVQETFMKAFDSIGSYNTDYAFSTWLYRIAKNHTIDYLRKKKLQTLSINEPVQTREGEMDLELPDKKEETDRAVIRKQRKRIIQEAIDNLPDKYRKVIRLRHMEEKSYQEISDELDLPLGTVKAHIYRARELLYKALKDRREEF
jgi:RNA polymerase sigma-70 factor (ECF subfamily)